MTKSLDTFKCRKTLAVGDKTYTYFSLPDAEANGLDGISKLPFSLKVILENLLRFEDGRTVTADDIRAVASWLATRKSSHEIAYRPARVLMQDFTGVPAVVDLAAMRDAVDQARRRPEEGEPAGARRSGHRPLGDGRLFRHARRRFNQNVEREYERNGERYEFLKLGAEAAFDNFRVVPPGTGICHQVNLEYLAQTVWTKDEDGETVAYPDTLVGTDSHTTMVNGLGVLGWGVGGIEAEAAMLGQPISMLMPEVVGFRLDRRAGNEGVTATDLVLTVVEMLRKKGVVGKFVEFYGPGLDNLPLEDARHHRQHGAGIRRDLRLLPRRRRHDHRLTCTSTGRANDRVALVEAYARAQGMWRDDRHRAGVHRHAAELDLATVVPSICRPASARRTASPSTPRRRVSPRSCRRSFEKA